jgi:hypothetical protein
MVLHFLNVSNSHPSILLKERRVIPEERKQCKKVLVLLHFFLYLTTIQNNLQNYNLSYLPVTIVYCYIKPEVLTGMNIKTVIFWYMTPCNMTDG